MIQSNSESPQKNMENRFWHKLRIWGSTRLKMFQPHALILLYHRIAEADSDPQLLCVSAQNFAEHLQILNHLYTPLSLQKLSEGLFHNHVSRRSIIITFDDGYADNLHQALPLLKQYYIPATVFVTSGAVDSPHEFWWDELERIFLLPGTLPEDLEIFINDKKHSWNLGKSSEYNESDYCQYRSWNINCPKNPTPRHEIYRTLCGLLRPMPAEQRQALLLNLINWAGIDTKGRASHRPLTTSEVKTLAANRLVEIGAHCITHPALSMLPPEQQQVEIQQSKKDLGSLLEKPVKSFSYPYGTLWDYTPETVRIVQESGFSCACSNFLQLVSRGTDCFQLPRFIVRNWSGPEFATYLKKWCAGDISNEYITS